MAKAIEKIKSPQPMSEEERRMQVARFLAQKRESFAQGALFNLLQNPSVDLSTAVKDSVRLADELMDELYPTRKD